MDELPLARPFDHSSLHGLGHDSLDDISLGRPSLLELPDPPSRGSPSSIAAEPDLENDDTDSPFYDVDADGNDEYDVSQDFSQDSVRLRNAVFVRDESQEDDDNTTDVMMTPAESELDETDSAVYEMVDDSPAGAKSAEGA